LPFENLSEEKANAYFADGIQDEILTKLALRTISKSSRRSRRPNTKQTRRLEDSGSRTRRGPTVLEGNVQKAAAKSRWNKPQTLKSKTLIVVLDKLVFPTSVEMWKQSLN
jgi:TolB-like protein